MHSLKEPSGKVCEYLWPTQPVKYVGTAFALFSYRSPCKRFYNLPTTAKPTAT
jgi:hypothetical protein